MRIRASRRRAVVFLVLGICLVALAAAFNVGWIVLNWREGALLGLGLLFFPLIVAGLVLNTIFLVREIRRNEQHNAFINAVTHELKTPVASIRLYLETLQSRAVEPAKQQEFYRIMLADSERLLSTVEQILRAGRAGHAQRAIEQHRLPLPELVRESAAIVTSRYDLAPGAISCSVAPEAERAVVAGDAGEMRAAIANLFDNAVKYSTPGVVAVQAALSGSDPFYWTLRITDQGRGIERGQLKAIFKRFYRVPMLHATPSAQVTGTGLGLFIVRSVIRRHGGRVFASSEGPGAGATFTVQLPRPTA